MTNRGACDVDHRRTITATPVTGSRDVSAPRMDPGGQGPVSAGGVAHVPAALLRLPFGRRKPPRITFRDSRAVCPQRKRVQE